MNLRNGEIESAVCQGPWGILSRTEPERVKGGWTVSTRGFDNQLAYRNRWMPHGNERRCCTD